MALRSLARKLGAPAIAALQRASPPRVSPAAGSGLRAFRSSQRGEVRRGAYHMKRAEAEAILRDVKKWNKEKELDYLEISRALDNLPRNIALSAAAAIFTGISLVAYVVGAFE